LGFAPLFPNKNSMGYSIDSRSFKI